MQASCCLTRNEGEGNHGLGAVHFRIAVDDDCLSFKINNEQKSGRRQGYQSCQGAQQECTKIDDNDIYARLSSTYIIPGRKQRQMNFLKQKIRFRVQIINLKSSVLDVMVCRIRNFDNVKVTLILFSKILYHIKY